MHLMKQFACQLIHQTDLPNCIELVNQQGVMRCTGSLPGHSGAVDGIVAESRPGQIQIGGADKNLDCEEVVHVFVRRQDRAVELYIKNALKGWYREYEQRLDLPVGYAGRETKYSQAQQEAAVEHCRSCFGKTEWIFISTGKTVLCRTS